MYRATFSVVMNFIYDLVKSLAILCHLFCLSIFTISPFQLCCDLALVNVVQCTLQLTLLHTLSAHVFLISYYNEAPFVFMVSSIICMPAPYVKSERAGRVRPSRHSLVAGMAFHHEFIDAVNDLFRLGCI